MSTNQSYKPEGYSTVSPYVIVQGAASSIFFIKQVFGAAELRRFTDEAGNIRHAEVQLRDTVIMLADSGNGWDPTSSHLHVYVPDVDATYEHALEAGGTSVQEPQKKDDEDKRGGVRGPGGITWWIATRVE